MKTFLTTLFITVALTSLSPAQTINVTSDTYLNSIGTTLTHVTGEVDTVQTPTVDAGSPGENQIWDLRNIVFADTIIATTQENLTPQQTIYTLFPEANYAVRLTSKAIVSTDTVDLSYFLGSVSYYKVSPSSNIFLGGVFGSTTKYAYDTTALPITHTYGDTWTDVNIDTTYILSFLSSIYTDSIVNTIDGYGTLKLPMGDFECVRVKSYKTNIDNEVISGTNTVTHYIGYLWETKEGLLLATLTSQANETNPDFTNPSSFSRLESINGSTVAIKDKKNLPHGFKLSQNYPNPFNPTTRISFTISKEGHVTLIVYSTLGQKVATLVNGIKQPGSYEVNFNGSKLSSGIYFYRLTTGQNVMTKKMILLK